MSDTRFGEHLPADAVEQLQFMPELTDEEWLIEGRERLTPADTSGLIAKIKQESGFHLHHSKLQIVRDVFNFVTTRGGRAKTYDDSIDSAFERTGHERASKYGIGTFGEQDCVMYILNPGFMGGSVGVMEGEDFTSAAQLATQLDLPLVSVLSTGGMRQQENFLALLQMTQGVKDAEEFKEATNQPFVTVLVGNVYGGTSASIVPQADVIIGVEGTDCGFAGPRVIGAYEGQMPEEGSQSVEVGYLGRQIDILVKPNDLTDCISELLRINAKNEGMSEELDARLSDANANEGRNIVTPKSGFWLPRISSDGGSARIHFPNAQSVVPDSEDPNDLYDVYKKIYLDPGRIDTEYMLRTAFNDYFPLFNQYRRDDRLVFPAIIGALAVLGGQEIMVVGNQPSYQISGDRVSKRSAMPRPEDFEWLAGTLQSARRMGLPVVSFIDTLGAEPSIRAERRGQSAQISSALKEIATYPHPFLSFVIGGLGSGGGIGSTNVYPRLFALDSAHLWVAEPTSAASIVQNTDSPTVDQVKELLSGYKCRPKDCEAMGVPMGIIEASTNPMVTASNIREVLFSELKRQIEIGPKKLYRERQATAKAIAHVVLAENSR